VSSMSSAGASHYRKLAEALEQVANAQINLHEHSSEQSLPDDWFDRTRDFMKRRTDAMVDQAQGHPPDPESVERLDLEGKNLVDEWLMVHAWDAVE
jgi:hypothetical protein